MNYFFRIVILMLISISAFSQEDLPKKNVSKRIKDYIDYASLFTRSALAKLNSSQEVLSLFGKSPFHNVPHVRANTPFGQLAFTKKETDSYIQAADSTPNGVSTYWVGPSLLGIYITSNEARKKLIVENKVGVVDEETAKIMRALRFGNSAMEAFPNFIPFKEESYKEQRRFLLKRFHAGASKLLPTIEKETQLFIESNMETKFDKPILLRDFTMGLILHNSSFLLGLSDSPLDRDYYSDPKVKNIFDNTAFYEIARPLDSSFELDILNYIDNVFKSNFKSISQENYEISYLKNLLRIQGVDPLPEDYTQYSKIPHTIRKKVAMTIAATIFGGMIHSSANSLDWAFYKLLSDKVKYNELAMLVEKHRDIDLTDIRNFEIGGELYPIGLFIMENVFDNPTFSHEFFFVRQGFQTTLPDNSPINIPSMSFLMINYLKCNQNQNIQVENILEKENTIGKFIMSGSNASFGGSLLNSKESHTRRCPGAKSSLYGQMVAISSILRDYIVTPVSKFSGELDTSYHPICTRENIGEMVIRRK